MDTGNASMHRGFTLVELLVSFLILSLGLVALSQLYLAAMWTYQKARHTSIATQRAQEELERAYSIGFGALSTGPHPLDYPTAEGYATLPADIQGWRGVSFYVDDLPGGQGTLKWRYYPPGDTHMLQMEVRIAWVAPRKAQAPDVKVVTLLVDPN